METYNTLFNNILSVARYFAFLCIIGYGWATYFDYSNGYTVLAVIDAVFAITGPIALYLSFQYRYSRVVVWYAVLTSMISIISTAFTQLFDPQYLAWLNLFPFIFFFFTNRKTGFILSSIGGACLILSYLTWEMFHEIPKIEITVFITFFLSYFVSTILASLYENQRIRKENILIEVAEKDSLTGLANRDSLDKTLYKSIENASINGETFTVILFDLDDFKSINDKFGHVAGDTVLRKMADIAKDCIRANDFIARWGGEEFFILLPSTDLEGGRLVAEKIRKSITEETRLEIVKFTASFGVTERRCSDTESSIFQRVDSVLYKAKSLGKNRVQIEK